MSSLSTRDSLWIGADYRPRVSRQYRPSRYQEYQWPLNPNHNGNFQCLRDVDDGGEKRRLLVVREGEVWVYDYSFQNTAYGHYPCQRLNISNNFNPSKQGGTIHKVFTGADYEYVFWVDRDGVHQQSLIALNAEKDADRLYTVPLLLRFESMIHDPASQSLFGLQFSGTVAQIYRFQRTVARPMGQWKCVFRCKVGAHRFYLGAFLDGRYIVSVGTGNSHRGDNNLRVFDVVAKKGELMHHSARWQCSVDFVPLRRGSKYVLHQQGSDSRITTGFIRKHQMEYKLQNVPLILCKMIESFCRVEGKLQIFDEKWRLSCLWKESRVVRAIRNSEKRHGRSFVSL